jgi:hypothetical protein
MMLWRKGFFSTPMIRPHGLTVLLVTIGAIYWGLLYFLLPPSPFFAEIAKSKSSQPLALAAPAITPAALDKLIQQAADAKYLRDVLGDKNSPHLPLPHHAMPLQTADSLLRATVVAPANVPAVATKSQAALQRCTYQQQTYVPGDIVKTPQGWLRCTPVIVPAGSAAAPVWTAVVP